MDKELDRKLVKTFPLLYTDRSKSMRNTCMCWGFECQDGWFDLIWELSEKIEPLIKKFKDDNPHGNCYECGCDYYDHRHMPSGKRVCTVIHQVPYQLFKHRYSCPIPQWKQDIKYYGFWKGIKKSLSKDLEQTKFKWRSKLNRWWNIWFKLGIKKKVPCKCIEFEHRYPRASQVKEKFGTLRFYMSSGTDEIYKHIDEAEKKSGEICEGCGAPGIRRGGGWIVTLCDSCAKLKDQEITYEEWCKEREAAGAVMCSAISISIRKQAK